MRFIVENGCKKHERWLLSVLLPPPALFVGVLRGGGGGGARFECTLSRACGKHANMTVERRVEVKV